MLEKHEEKMASFVPELAEPAGIGGEEGRDVEVLAALVEGLLHLLKGSVGSQGSLAVHVVAVRSRIRSRILCKYTRPSARATTTRCTH